MQIVKPKPVPINTPPKVVQAPKLSTQVDVMTQEEKYALIDKHKQGNAKLAYKQSLDDALLRHPDVHSHEGLINLTPEYRAYSTDGYKQINRVLRDGPDAISVDVRDNFLQSRRISVEDAITKLKSEIESAQGIAEDITLYRGLSGRLADQIDNILKTKQQSLLGMEFAEHKFISTSFSKSIASDFVETAIMQGATERPVLLQILTPKGTKTIPMDTIEKELVLHPDTRYKVLAYNETSTVINLIVTIL